VAVGIAPTVTITEQIPGLLKNSFGMIFEDFISKK
jgi:hypothetical protein